jgi:hypothetical protein
MTESEFETQLLNLSTKMADLITQPGGDIAKSQLGPLAKSVTGTSDLDSALAALTADRGKLDALESQFAARVASPGAAGATGNSGSSPTQTSPGSATPTRGYMWVGPIISFAIIAGFFAMLIVLLWQQHQVGTHAGQPVLAAAENNAGASTPTTSSGGLQNVLFTLLGALGAAFTQVVNFWLGSSKGSSDKTDLIAATVAAQTQSQQPQGTN